MKETKQEMPTESSINKYGFLYLNKETLAALGFQKPQKVTLQKTPEGLLVTKADDQDKTTKQ